MTRPEVHPLRHEIIIKPLDPKVAWTWAAAWDKRDLTRARALSAIKPLLLEPHCVVVLTQRVDGAPFRTVLHHRAKSAAEPVHYQAPTLSPEAIRVLERLKPIAIRPGFYNGAYIDSEILIVEQGPVDFSAALDRAKNHCNTRCRCPVIYTYDYPAEYASA